MTLQNGVETLLKVKKQCPAVRVAWSFVFAIGANVGMKLEALRWGSIELINTSIKVHENRFDGKIWSVTALGKNDGII